ncbi:MAG: MBL fold metallo-hydrolase, partial [Candidatus Adiutrix sp.]
GKVDKDYFKTGDSLDFGPLKVRSVQISHDAVEPVCFVIGNEQGELGLATDLGAVTTLLRQNLLGLRALVLEFNHDYRLLMDGPYPWPLKQRVRSRVGHLSNEVAAELAAYLCHPDLKYLVLAHLSETNNHPDLALKAASGALNNALIPIAASQNQATKIFEF